VWSRNGDAFGNRTCERVYTIVSILFFLVSPFEVKMVVDNVSNNCSVPPRPENPSSTE